MSTLIYLNYGCISFTNRLREILLHEEERYITELETQEETTEGRQNRMKERAKELKDRRETERKEYVAQKMEQKFRYGNKQKELILQPCLKENGSHSQAKILTLFFQYETIATNFEA